jgi:hypothetical protein
MTERKPHPDNELIDAMEQDSGGATRQNLSSGGDLARDIGTRAEQRTTESHLEGDEVDRAKGSDNPAQDELKGDKTIGAMPTTPDRD